MNPALFTSVNDSTVGGDTGTGTPAAGDWGGIELSGAGSVDLAYTDLEYAIQGLFGSTTGSLSMVGDQWANFVTGGLQASAGEVTVENSTVNDAGSAPAFWVYSSSLDFDHLTGNSVNRWQRPRVLRRGNGVDKLGLAGSACPMGHRRPV